MSTATKAEVLADHKRLLEEQSFGEELWGIVTTDVADGVLYVLSRYSEDVWTLPPSRFPSNFSASSHRLDFQTINEPQLRAEAKRVMVRLLFSPENFSGRTLVHNFINLRSWVNWLRTESISSHAQVTPLVASLYVQHVNQLRSNRGKKGPLGSRSKYGRFAALETCWKQLGDTPARFPHPWPESSPGALAKYSRHDKATTRIIPDEVLAPLFQFAEFELSRANELLDCYDAVAGLTFKTTCSSSQNRQKNHLLKTRGWSAGLGSLKASLLTLRDCCFLIILTTTGIRAHELGNIRRNQWFSEVKDGERFYFLCSRSDKTHEGETDWLCPEIAITALKVLERLSAPLQADLVAAREAARECKNYAEINRCSAISGHVGLTQTSGQSNRISVLCGNSLIERLQKLATHLNLDWTLTPHQFRRSFANHVVHHKLGDLRYLRDHFKHWSLDMTALYAMNEKQDMELFDHIYAAFGDKRQAIIGHWLEPDTKLSGGMANHVREMRSRNEKVRTYKDRKEMVQTISDMVFLRSTGIAWCTNDTGVDCAGGQCESCEHGCLDDTHKPFWEGLYLQQIELRQIDDFGDSGSKTVERTIERCEQVLSDLGVDLTELKGQIENASFA